MVNIKFKNIAISAYIYIILPIVIFFLTWLRWYIGMPMAIMLVFGLIVLLKKDYLNNTTEISLPIKHLIGIGAVILIWNWLSGQGGFFFQTGDNHWRNAIFRDLINFQWPVIYPETGNGLVYYLMHWIVPALFGKLLGWTGGNIALLIWTYLGIMIAYLLIIYITKATSIGKMWLVCVVFIFWSGLNVIGLAISDTLGITVNKFGLGSAEGWLDYNRNGFDCSYLYRNNFDFLSQVYNQAVVPWIAVSLMLENKKIRNFAFIGLSVLPYAPIPFIGFIPIFGVIALPDYIAWFKSKKFKSIVEETFSISNVAALLTIFIVFLFYFRGNVSYTTGAAGKSFGLFVPIEAFDVKRIFTLILFYILEFGIIAFLIYPIYKKDKLFWMVIIVLIVIPQFRIGTGRDFCMNASLAPLFILMIMTIRFMFKESEKKIESIRKNLLVAVLAIAMLSPVFDIVSRFHIIKDAKQFPMVADDIKTLSDKNFEGFENFLSPQPEKKFFYKHLAK